MNLGDFHTMVRNECNKGTKPNTRIVSATRQAARWMERNYTLRYMRRFVSFTLDVDNVYPRAVAQPARIKSIQMLRYSLPDGDDTKFYKLFKIDPRDVTAVKDDYPTSYWLDGDEWIWFDNQPDDDLPLEMIFSQYTNWPTSDSEEPWLLANAEDAMLAKTMQLMAPYLRENSFLQTYKPMLDEGIRTLLLADEEFDWENTDNFMGYGVEYDNVATTNSGN